MDKIVCQICGKEFEKHSQLTGHMKVHTTDYQDYIKRVQNTHKEKSRLNRKKLEDEYNLNPKLCEGCGKPLTYQKAIINKCKTCCLSCSVKVGNLKRGGHSQKTKDNIAKGVTKFFNTDEGKSLITKRKKPKICKNCGKTFYRNHHRDGRGCCSMECAREMISKKRIENIKKGATNTSFKWLLTYNGIEYRCDSKLEAASIIWLFEHFNALKISRCEDIIEYYDDNFKKHRYNPDFDVNLENEDYIVEVKQTKEKMSKSSLWKNYHETLEIKQKVLKDYASDNNKKSLWLTPKYDIELARIYTKLTHPSNPYGLVKL